MRLIIKDKYDDVCQYTAEYVLARINEFNPTAERPFVLGLPTGSSPIGVYKKLVQFHREGMLSFKHVITFNM
ncbi:Glucosamine-6-phosphate isomerase 2, partial [Rhizoclosmatium hyalinum]